MTRRRSSAHLISIDASTEAEC
ncbi:hypothetical protein CCACVL1_07290 [Corchorus capsularis]|uniref:Uncharacterized protein n=1 Tax=Corchorus capsularis TaxID=210143 RepID=A0A1R3J7I8_COCAP|nr:hypothetical protein CCACVL1_07290 [Corchorus capsularis]